MKSFTFLVSVLCVAGIATALAQTPPATVDGLLSGAKSAAGLEWPGTYLRLCIPPAPAQGARGTPPAGAPARETWYAEPAKVADNLYFVGTKIHNAWAIAGTEGIIVIEALFDYAAQDEIIGGIKSSVSTPARSNTSSFPMRTATMTAARSCFKMKSPACDWSMGPQTGT